MHDGCSIQQRRRLHTHTNTHVCPGCRAERQERTAYTAARCRARAAAGGAYRVKNPWWKVVCHGGPSSENGFVDADCSSSLSVLDRTRSTQRASWDDRHEVAVDEGVSKKADPAWKRWQQATTASYWWPCMEHITFTYHILYLHLYTATVQPDATLSMRPPCPLSGGRPRPLAPLRPAISGPLQVCSPQHGEILHSESDLAASLALPIPHPGTGPDRTADEKWARRVQGASCCLVEASSDRSAWFWDHAIARPSNLAGDGASPTKFDRHKH
ncbi:hypothetical protein CDD83_11125 [Cordyceps sp. RAO-2017]|nr:hypothetical protein CDD83_11125 [Cordyceps sp. RAO-2017]